MCVQMKTEITREDQELRAMLAASNAALRQHTHTLQGQYPSSSPPRQAAAVDSPIAPLLNKYYSLLIAHCSLLIVTAHCSLNMAHCSLHTVCCSLFIAYCSLIMVHCSLIVAHCSLLTAPTHDEAVVWQQSSSPVNVVPSSAPERMDEDRCVAPSRGTVTSEV